MPELKATNEGIKLKGDHSIAKYLLGENEKRKKTAMAAQSQMLFFLLQLRRICIFPTQATFSRVDGTM